MNQAAKEVLDHLHLTESKDGKYQTVHKNKGWRQVFLETIQMETWDLSDR